MIGILAGMGPMSTAPFIQLLMEKWQQAFKAKDDIEFPHTMIYSLPTPFYLNRPLDHLAIKTSICQGLLKLQEAGADFIAMPCNTAHRYFSDLQIALNIKLINMIDITVNAISNGFKNITVLATEPTIASGLYQSGIGKMDKNFVFDSKWQKIINQLIFKVKKGDAAANLHKTACDLITEIEQYDVEALIIGCTDISPIIRKYATHITIIDASEQLISAIIEEVKNQKTRQTDKYTGLCAILCNE